PGDSIYFDSNLRHSYRCASEETCAAFMVLAYPERNLTERRTDNLGSLHTARRPTAPIPTATLKILEPPEQNGAPQPENGQVVTADTKVGVGEQGHGGLGAGVKSCGGPPPRKKRPARR